MKENIIDDLQWDKVNYILEFSEPIYAMIRATDTDKPCLHLMYSMWHTMIEKVKTIIYHHEGKAPNEESEFFSIVHEILVAR